MLALLDTDLIKQIHVELINTYGGSHGLRDAGLLQSAVDRAENRAHFNPNASLGSLAAALGWGLIKNHVFIDGNKRIGLAAVITFLRVNRHELVCAEDETQEMVLHAAASEISEQQWTDWMERVVAPLSSERQE